MCVVVRVEKMKPQLPKLILPPGNMVIPQIEKQIMMQTSSPSPSPIPPDVDYDVEFDPDNMVIPGSRSTTPNPINNDDEQNGSINRLDDFTFTTHT